MRQPIDDSSDAPAGPFRLPRITYQDPSLQRGVDLDDKDLMASLLADTGDEQQNYSASSGL